MKHFAFLGSDGQARCGTAADAAALLRSFPFARAETVKEIPRPPGFDEVLDPATLTVIPDPAQPRRAKLAALAATDAGVIRGVDDVWTFLIVKGIAKPADRPAPLAAKLDERAALRAALASAVEA